MRDVPRLAAFTLMMYVAPAVLEDLLSRRGPEGDEPDDILRWALTSTLQYSSLQLILVRDIMNAATTGYSYRMSPMADAGASIGRVMGDIGKTIAWGLGGEEPDWSKVPGHLVEASGPVLGLPSKQIMRTVRGLSRMGENDWNPWDLVMPKPRR